MSRPNYNRIVLAIICAELLFLLGGGVMRVPIQSALLIAATCGVGCWYTSLDLR